MQNTLRLTLCALLFVACTSSLEEDGVQDSDASNNLDDAGNASDADVASDVDRIVFVYTPHGTIPQDWTPTKTETGYEFGPILAPFESLKEKVVVVSGLDFPAKPFHPTEGPVDTYTYHTSTALTGHSTFSNQPGSGLWPMTAASPSVDTIISQAPQNASVPIKAFHLGVSTMDYFQYPISFDSPAVPTISLSDPRDAIATLNAVLVDDAGKELDAETQLDYVRLQKDVSELPATIHWVEMFDQVLDLQSRILRMALLADVTRVGTLKICAIYCLARFHWLQLQQQSTYHTQSHDPDTAPFRSTQIWLAEQIAAFAQDLDKTIMPSGDSLLDHTLIVWVSETGAHRAHETRNIPIVLIGNVSGKLKTGQFLEFGDRYHNDLLLTVARVMGVDTDFVGDPALVTGEIAQLLSEQ